MTFMLPGNASRNLTYGVHRHGVSMVPVQVMVGAERVP